MKQSKNSDIAFDEQPTSQQEDTSFGDILSQFEQEHAAEGERGVNLKGTVVAVTDENVFVDIGRKTEGIIPAERLRDRQGEMLVKPGDVIDVNVGGRNQEGYYELSTIRVERPRDWTQFESAFASGAAIAGTVTEVVKGGLRVDVGVRAFMPASRSGARDIAEMEKLVGQEIQCRITKLDTATEDVVVDRRAILEEQEKAAKEARFGAVEEGQIVTGTVKSLMDFGAFVDIGGVDGLLHVADISWHRIGKPADVLTAGQQVEVKVLKVNRETKKISLGMKQLMPDPWTVAAGKYKVGDRVNGTVARLADFGAFINLEAGVDGLVHVSEMSWSKKVRKPSDMLKVGDAVEVVVLGVNPGEKRISLGLKQALGDPWELAKTKYAIGATVEGPITNMTNFGAFVDLGDGLEGMIHVGDITREKRLDHPKDVLKNGQVVKAQVLELDKERRRIRLGMKQLEPTSADEYIAEHQPGETVTGRVVEVHDNRAKVELGEGVTATCKLGQATEQAKPVESGDLSSRVAMLAAKWKQGSVGDQGDSGNALRPGQIRTFKIVSLDAAQKRIQVELT